MEDVGVRSVQPTFARKYSGYTVRDPYGERIGKVTSVFLDEDDRLEYFVVSTGFLVSRLTLIPADLLVSMDEDRGFVEVSQTRSRVEEAPTFENKELKPEYERWVRWHYGLQTRASS